MTYLYVGIDGGGTSCRARIRDAQGRLLGEGKSGSANILLGIESALTSIVDAVTTAATQAELTSTDFTRMHLGLALAGAEQKSAWFAMMEQPHPFASIVLNTDAYGACLGAHDGQDGAILIAGTGSCGLLINGGEQQVVGGREFPISDQGSGAMMGLRLIQKVLLAYDDIEPQTPLYHYVMTHFHHDVDAIVAWSKQALPRDYGQFSPQIFQFADEGCPLAQALLQQTRDDIEMWLQALRRRGATRICLMGGVAERMQAWLSPPMRSLIVPAKFDAIEGALMFAGKPEHNLYRLSDIQHEGAQ